MSNQKDYRMSFIRSVETALADHFSADQIYMISNVIARKLSEYEITQKCTDLVVYDDTNEKLMKGFFACLLVDGRSKGTIKTYGSHLKRFSNAVKKPFTEVNTGDVLAYMAFELERGLAASTRDEQRTILLTFFQWMVDCEIIPKNPVAKLKPIKCPKVEKKPFSDVEIDTLRSACKSPKERALIEILLATGIRVNELVTMKVEDINFDTLAVHVVHGKGSKERVTYITPVAVSHLLKYLNSRQEDGGYLIYNMYHKQMTTDGIRWILTELSNRSGVENVHPHRFRRTFATMLAKRGMDIQEIQRLMGHSNLNTTMTYISMDDTNIQSSYRKHIA